MVVSGEAARRKLRSAQRHYFSKRYSMAAHMQEKEGTSAALEDAAASIEAKRAGEAVVELETEGVAYGEVALSVAVRGAADRLEQWRADVQRVFGGLDAKAARESYGQLAVWFGRLPGQPASRQPRRVFVSAGVSACLAPLLGPPRGDRRCAHLDAPALTVFETPAGAPYHYDLFGGRDVGHTLMLGATGAGKSFIRHGTVTLFAALSYLEGKLIYRTEQQHTHVEWLRFLKQIDRETPEDVDLHLIADKYCTHKHGKVVSWLKKHQRSKCISFRPRAPG